MNINELEELANIWVFCEDEEDSVYAKSFLELIAAYREAVAALRLTQEGSEFFACIQEEISWAAAKDHAQMQEALATAKRLGVE